MGYNTTVVVMNDALSDIERDPEFGKKLSRAISHLSVVEQGQTVDVSAMSHCNAATAIESHHADGTSVVAVGGNRGVQLNDCYLYPYGDEDYKVRVLRALADELGYHIRKKPQRKSS